MTVDGHLTDDEAAEKLRPISSPDAFKELKNFILKQNDFIYADS